MTWTKENNPHTQGSAPKRAKRAEKKSAVRASANQYTYKGVKQVGDVKLWNDKNVSGYAKLYDVPLNMVGPLDIVDDEDPKQRYTFYLYVPSQNDDSARELDRLRRGGYFKCAAPRFISPTAKFETRDGVLVLGRGIWYACPEDRMSRNQQNRGREAVDLIAGAHASLAATAKAAGFEAEAQTRNDLRGQRLK
jgi:hypothetical protein